MRPKIPNDFHVTPFSVLFYTASTTTTSTLSLHDALPISNSRSLDSPKERARWTGLTSFRLGNRRTRRQPDLSVPRFSRPFPWDVDRKSTRLNSSHVKISYAVFCLKKTKLGGEWIKPCKMV